MTDRDLSEEESRSLKGAYERLIESEMCSDGHNEPGAGIILDLCDPINQRVEQLRRLLYKEVDKFIEGMESEYIFEGDKLEGEIESFWLHLQDIYCYHERP